MVCWTDFKQLCPALNMFIILDKHIFLLHSLLPNSIHVSSCPCKYFLIDQLLQITQVYFQTSQKNDGVAPCWKQTFPGLTPHPCKTQTFAGPLFHIAIAFEPFIIYYNCKEIEVFMGVFGAKYYLILPARTGLGPVEKLLPIIWS